MNNEYEKLTTIASKMLLSTSGSTVERMFAILSFTNIGELSSTVLFSSVVSIKYFEVEA